MCNPAKKNNSEYPKFYGELLGVFILIFIVHNLISFGTMTRSMGIILNGILTGLAFQIAIGPVYIFIVNIALKKTVMDSVAAVLGVAIADYFYILLAIVGVGKLLESNIIKKTFGIISSVALIVIGFFLILTTPAEIEILATEKVVATPFSSFLTVFFMTLSNPLTILFFTGVFSVKIIEFDYNNIQLWIFGASTGLATILFIGASVIIFSFLSKSVPLKFIQIMNMISGGLIIIYGLLRFRSSKKNFA